MKWSVEFCQSRAKYKAYGLARNHVYIVYHNVQGSIKIIKNRVLDTVVSTPIWLRDIICHNILQKISIVNNYSYKFKIALNYEI